MTPVFYHVPKCGGTYVKNITTRLLLKVSNNQLNIYHCKDNDNNTLMVVWCDKTPLNIPKTPLGQRGSHLQVRCDDFISHKNRLHRIYAVMIESHGFKKQRELLSNFPIRYSFMLLRDSFDRQQSLFNYITFGRSHHEKSHGSLKSKSLEEFLGSYEVDDCWIIRQFLDLPNNHSITEDDFRSTCEIMKDVMIADVSRVKQLVDKVFSKCYGITTDDIDSNVYAHVGGVPKTCKDDIDKDILCKFNQRTIWDQKLYAHFT